MADRSNCAVGAVMDQAMVNVGAIYAKQVDGRVCTDVDAHLANDEAAMVAKVSALARLYSAAGVPASKTIYRLPATWAGIQAAKQLEAKGISTQVYLVFSMIQAVAAAQAGVSVIQPNVGRIRECFVKFPNASHDFGVGGEGPAHFIDPSDAGIKLVQQISAYVHKHHPSKTAVMASGVRTKDDALRLSGVNYMILPSRVIAELSATPTTTGYNDGLRMGEDDEGEAALHARAAAELEIYAMGLVDQATFDAALGFAANELMKEGLAQQVADADAAMPLFQKSTTAHSAT